MGSFYNLGEKKIRPGVYRRYENVGSSDTPGAVYGVFAIAIHAMNGPLATVSSYSRDDIEDFKNTYGTEGTADAVLALFDGGATKVHVYRLGSGGTNGEVAISESETTLVNIKTKYPTSIPFSITVKEKLGETGVKQLLLYNGAELVETIEFASGASDSANLVEAINSNSIYLTATKSADGTVPNVSGTQLSEGTDPTVNTESYSEAFTAFEPFKWNMLVIDTVDTAVHALVKSYINRIFLECALGVCALGEPTTVDFDTRKSHASSFNDEKIIYFGSGYEDADSNKVDGYKAIAVQAGIIGSMESNQSATHTVIPGAVNTLEVLKNSQYEQAISSGMVLLSPNDEGQVWFDSAVNTLVIPGENQDDGWKKIRRTSTRFEMFDRIDRALAPLIGKVDCDDIGVGDCVLRGQDVLDAMIKESKLMDGAVFSEDTTKTRGSDYAYFVIEANDKDSLEKIYLTYQFRFTAE
jgi:hypothetical protein